MNHLQRSPLLGNKHKGDRDFKGLAKVTQEEKRIANKNFRTPICVLITNCFRHTNTEKKRQKDNWDSRMLELNLLGGLKLLSSHPKLVSLDTLKIPTESTEMPQGFIPRVSTSNTTQPDPEPAFPPPCWHGCGPCHHSEGNVTCTSHTTNTSINLCTGISCYCLNKPIDVAASIQGITIPNIPGNHRPGC